LGLAYYAYSRLEGGEGPGAWQVMAGVSPENVSLTIEKAQAEIERLCNELVSEEELDDNQSYFTGRLPLRLESNSGIANILEALERYDLGLDYLANYTQTIRTISREDILSAAQRYLRPERLVISVAEPE
jgi:zinc protease